MSFKIPEVKLVDSLTVLPEEKTMLMQWVGAQIPRMDQLDYLLARGYFILSSTKVEIRVIELSEITVLFDSELKQISFNLRSAQQSLFEQTEAPANIVKLQKIDMGYNRTNLSNYHKTTFDLAELIPIYVRDVLPGTTTVCRNEFLIRTLPLASPAFEDLRLRLIGFSFQDSHMFPEFDGIINGRGIVGRPTIDGDAWSSDSVGCYFGIPNGMSAGEVLNAYPFAGYFKIYDEYYRNANIQSEEFIDLVPGDNALLTAKVDSPPLKINWGKDRFSNGLISPQVGPDLMIALSNTDVLYRDSPNSDPAFIRNASNRALPGAGTPLEVTAASALSVGGSPKILDPNGTLYVNASIPHREIRLTEAITKVLEKDMTGGERHSEYLWKHYKVKSRDLRLDRPKFIGRHTDKLIISEIQQTAETIDSTDTITSPAGVLAGKGAQMGSGKPYVYTAPDHGWIMCIMCCRPRASYSQGIPKMFQRETRFDYYFNDLARIGDVAVKTKEVYALGTAVEGNTDFNYQPIYSEYLFQQDLITGQMRTSVQDYWHLGRQLGGPPSYNDAFVTCNPGKRIFADTSAANDSLVGWFINHVIAAQPVSAAAMPSL